MRQSHLLEHLEAARKLAEADNEMFVAYLIKMAKEAMRKRDTREGGKSKSAIAA